jgi:4-alpha-glucanotransferase
MALSEPRQAGVLLHVSSLPGPGANGALGPDAYRFVDFLASAGMAVWQVLPVNPTGGGGSPYAAESSFAGSPALIAPGANVGDGDAACEDPGAVLRREFGRIGAAQRAELARFAAEASWWLEDWALFAALQGEYGLPWQAWPAGLAGHEPAALDVAQVRFAGEIGYQRFLQWRFESQWNALRNYARKAGIRLFGDLPIFPALQSADTWAYRESFKLDAGGWPEVVAGVPPDAFSATGQRWGNPHYDWAAEKQRRYPYWRARLRRAFELYDMVRIDHFRGFAAAWEIDAGEPTAVRGRWVPGPGRDVFDALAEDFGEMAIVVEDLGIITDDVRALRDGLGYPGMAVLQFAFDGSPDNPYLPGRIVPNSVVYTGTHDNDTTAGWWASLSPEERERVRAATGAAMADPPRELMRLAFASAARLAVVPFQDLLGLGSEARMNTPGTVSENWGWRFDWGQVPDGLAADVAGIASACGREPPLRYRAAP